MGIDAKEVDAVLGEIDTDGGDGLVASALSACEPAPRAPAGAGSPA